MPIQANSSQSSSINALPQYMSILDNQLPIPDQSGIIPAGFYELTNPPISAHLCQYISIHADHVPIEGQLLIQTQLSNLPIPPNRANPCQFSANSLPIQCQSMSIFCQSGAIPRSIFPFNDHFPISQSWPSHANPPIQCQSVPICANPMPISQSQANRPIPGQSANPVPILCHY